MKFIITCIALLISLNSFSQLMGWTLEQVVKLKGADYKYAFEGTDEEYGDRYNISYKKKYYIEGNTQFNYSEEIFSFRKSSNVVFKYMYYGAKKESDILAIIESNNQKFKVIDKGKMQSDFIWHDEKTGAIYQLEITFSIGNGDYKRINYTAIGK